MIALAISTLGYTLPGGRTPAARRHAACIAVERPYEGRPTQVGLSARALDQIANASPEQRKGLKELKKRAGKKKSTDQFSQKSGKGFGSQKAQKFDRRPADDAACCCGLGGMKYSYAQCCKEIHDSGYAPDPAALVRARYSAYAYRLPDFLIDSTSQTHEEWQEDRPAWKKSLMQFCDNFVFEKLEVGEHEAVMPGAVETVAFRASMVQKGAVKMLDLLETSTIVREGDRWLYAKGDVTYEASPVVEGEAAAIVEGSEKAAPDAGVVA